jgi:hypothetical protein
MLSPPIAGDKPLEVQLILEEVIESPAVLRTITVVDLVVRAHYSTYTCTYSICKWPASKLGQDIHRGIL